MKHEDAFQTIVNELKHYDLYSVADASGVDISTLYTWIKGKYKARYSNLEKVANVLGFDISVTAIRN